MCFVTHAYGRDQFCNLSFSQRFVEDPEARMHIYTGRVSCVITLSCNAASSVEDPEARNRLVTHEYGRDLVL